MSASLYTRLILVLFISNIPSISSFRLNDQINITLTGYILEKENSGIKIYHKRNPRKGFIEYKAITFLEGAELESFMEFFTNAEKHPKWVYKCLKSQLSQRDNHNYLYQVLKSTWPLKNRDLSVEVITKKPKKDKTIVDFISKSGIKSENSKYVRINEFNSRWEIVQTKTGLELAVTTSFDPRISTGGFLLKPYTTKIPFETLKKLKQIYQPKKN